MKSAIYKPYRHQKFGEKHLIKNRFAALLLEMGLGKTVITLTVIWKLIFVYREVHRVLVIAPKKVASKVWPDELEKWAHLKGLTYSKVIGTARERIRALSVKADIYIINRENVPWLKAFYGERWPFDMVVIDESSSFKNHDSERFKAIAKVRPKTYRWVHLTGTPASNSLLDLWAQMYLLDLGERLGKTITYYRDNFFNVESWIRDNVAKYELLPGADTKIYNAIKDICISMQTRDYIDLPPKIDNIIDVELSKKVLKQYYEFEKEQVLKLINEEEITAVSASALSTKLRQFASGFVYDEDKVAHDVHNFKMELLEEYVDSLNGKPLLVFYWFRHTREKLLHKFRKLKPLTLKDDGEIDTWNRGKSSIMFLHPGSAAHGLNLQFGGCTELWYENTWSLELKLQAEARLMRPGQEHTVINNMMRAVGTIDERMIESNIRKDKGQRALMAATKALVKKYS